MLLVLSAFDPSRPTKSGLPLWSPSHLPFVQSGCLPLRRPATTFSALYFCNCNACPGTVPGGQAADLIFHSMYRKKKETSRNRCGRQVYYYYSSSLEVSLWPCAEHTNGSAVAGGTLTTRSGQFIFRPAQCERVNVASRVLARHERTDRGRVRPAGQSQPGESMQESCRSIHEVRTWMASSTGAHQRWDGPGVHPIFFRGRRV